MALKDGFRRQYMLNAFKAIKKDLQKHFDFGGYFFGMEQS